MASIVYSKLEGGTNPFYGQFDKPIKMAILDESNQQEKEKGILDFLYVVEKSNRFGESVVGESDFDTFMHAGEGQRGENDSVHGTFKKFIEHIAFMKEFTITKEMMDDAKFGIGTEMKQRPRKFVRSYYRTRTKIAAWALTHGTEREGVFNKAKVNLTCCDGEPLFSAEHPYSDDSKMHGLKQSNYFAGAFTSDLATLEVAIATLANKMRNFKTDDGETMGYVPDVIIIPCNQPRLEMMVKKLVGTERTAGSNNNDINTQYGNWTIVVLDGWETSNERFMLMSSAANKNLLGNLFFNRVNLDVRSEVDTHTRNYCWNGYCRFGIGFNAWKHILLAVNGTDAAATTLTIEPIEKAE